MISSGLKNIFRSVPILAALLALSGCAPKVLVSNQYLGQDKIAKFLLQPAGGQSMGKKGDAQYNLYGRVCDLDKKSGKSSDCQETLLLDGVQAGALYKK